MRPIRGVVVGVHRSALRIKIESGITVITQKRKGYRIGTKCWVAYDFTTGKVKSLYNHDPTLEIKEDTTEEVENKTVGGVDEAVVEASGIPSSGALPPDSDCWEFWDSDSGVLKLS